MAEQIKLRDPLAKLTSEEVDFLYINPPEVLSDFTQRRALKTKLELSKQLLSRTYLTIPIPPVIIDAAEEIYEQGKARRAEFEAERARYFPDYSEDDDLELQEFRRRDRGLLNLYADNPVFDSLSFEEESVSNPTARTIFTMVLEQASVSHPDGPLSSEELRYVQDIFAEDSSLSMRISNVRVGGVVIQTHYDQSPIFPATPTAHASKAHTFPLHLIPDEDWI